MDTYRWATQIVGRGDMAVGQGRAAERSSALPPGRQGGGPLCSAPAYFAWARRIALYNHLHNHPHAVAFCRSHSVFSRV